MSSQQRLNTCQEVNNPAKRKKAGQIENLDSARKQEKGKVATSDGSQILITGYLKRSGTIQKSFSSLEEKHVDLKGSKSKQNDPEEQLREKDKLILELKNRKQDELQKINNLLFEGKELKKRSRNVIAKSYLELAELKRIDRHKKDERLGYFTQNMRSFMDGEIVISLKRSIQAKECDLNRLHEQKNGKNVSREDMVRIVSSYDFIFRELNQLRNELKYREKEVAIYKDRMKLAEKEVRSTYYRQGWPIAYDRYQTLELLGAGGFGEVYKCFDLDSNRLVALKFITNKESGASEQEKEDFLRRMQREADIQKQLSHPNIAAFHSLVDIDKTEGKIVFELEYCNGIELSVYLRKEQCLEEKEAKLIIRQLFQAIRYLSQLKERVIHYDLKPSNIMLCDGVVKILDFGLCKVMTNSEQSRMELTSQGVGTYWYLPPQTFESYDPMISCKVDVWSLGVIFYELLYGKKPFAAGISQTEIYERDLIKKCAMKPSFPKENPRKYIISESALSFITLCLKYNSSERPTPQEAFKHPYLKKE